LAKFSGVGRRFDVKGVVNGIHGNRRTTPSPGRNSCDARSRARLQVQPFPGLFQPHRYSRTQHLWDDFSRAFIWPDVVVLTDVYAASEQPIQGWNSEAPRQRYARSRAQGMSSIFARCTKASSICCVRRAPATPSSPSERATSAVPATKLMVLLGTEHPTTHAH